MVRYKAVILLLFLPFLSRPLFSHLREEVARYALDSIDVGETGYAAGETAGRSSAGNAIGTATGLRLRLAYSGVITPCLPTCLHRLALTGLHICS